MYKIQKCKILATVLRWNIGSALACVCAEEQQALASSGFDLGRFGTREKDLAWLVQKICKSIDKVLGILARIAGIEKSCYLKAVPLCADYV